MHDKFCNEFRSVSFKTSIRYSPLSLLQAPMQAPGKGLSIALEGASAKEIGIVEPRLLLNFVNEEKKRAFSSFSLKRRGK